MIDLGLASGIKDLWHENELQDYTIIVDEYKFRVHRVVLAGISRFFKVLLCKPFLESKTDEVVVKGFSADIVSKLLEFIYTGEESIIADDMVDILHSAIYLQMPLVAEFCVKKLMENLNHKNCFEVLSATIEYSFQEDTKVIKKFMKTNWHKVMENLNPEVTSHDAMQVLIDLWEGSEWDLFLCIKNWTSVNFQERIMPVNDLMSQVRFCLIGPEELESIKRMEVYTAGEHSWHSLVEKALDYHQLPISQKVLYKSEQSTVKQEPSPCFFIAHTGTVTYFRLDSEKEWQQYEEKMPELPETSNTVCIQVNNFLIACTSTEETQFWHIFDPRTLKWSKMASVKKWKYGFALVYHNNHMYTVGGRYSPEVPSFETNQYSFKEDEWISAYGIPLALHCPAACVLQDTIYVSGGLIKVTGFEDLQPCDRLYCLNLESTIPEWERKASCLWGCVGHKMSVIDRGGEKALFVIDQDLELQFYSPSTDQWSTFTNELIENYFIRDLLDEGVVFVKGNSVFILNLYKPEDDDEHRRICFIWIIPEEGTVMTEVSMDDFPEMIEEHCFRNYFGDMLAISPQYL